MSNTNIGVSNYIEDLLKLSVEEFERVYEGSDAIYLNTPLEGDVDRLVRLKIEALKEGSNRDRLAVFVQTFGGEIRVIERLVLIFRYHYREVCFFVPDYAYSAGTALVMSGDRIYMDYDSVLGPTDTQIYEKGELVSATGYLEKYREMVESSRTEKGIAPAELELLIEKFDHGKLFDFEQSLLRTEKVVAEWLVKYKFKDWKTHSSDGSQVTVKQKRALARKIAKWLNDAKRWSSHGKGISVDVLREDLQLKIDALDKSELGESAIKYHRLTVDYCRKIGAQIAIHTRNGLSAPGTNREEMGS